MIGNGPRLRGGTLAGGILLAAVVWLLAAAPARAQTMTFTGNVDVSGTAARYQTVTAPVDGTLSATLDWTSPTAKLIIVLSRQNPDKSWTWLMNVTGQKPEMLSIPATAGRYRLGVKAKSGASDYSLMVNLPDAPPDNTYLTLLFSRSEITVADNCVENDTGVARLDTVVAPELARRGLTGTGTVETGVTRDATYACLHYKKSLGASWSDLAMLRDSYGWSFVSHSRTYAQNWSSMTRQQQLSETCGSLQDLLDHGHTRADGLFAYPNNSWSADVETNVVSTCFAFGRKYAQRVASRSEVTTAPYWDPTAQVGGGRCNNPALPCAAGSSAIYRSPDQVAAMVAGLQQGQWLTLQAYVLVTGSRPGLWDCTSADWHDHWTNDWERYCYGDYLRILDAVPAGVTITDPKTVGEAWGRVAPSPAP